MRNNDLSCRYVFMQALLVARWQAHRTVVKGSRKAPMSYSKRCRRAAMLAFIAPGSLRRRFARARLQQSACVDEVRRYPSSGTFHRAETRVQSVHPLQTLNTQGALPFRSSTEQGKTWVNEKAALPLFNETGQQRTTPVKQASVRPCQWPVAMPQGLYML